MQQWSRISATLAAPGSFRRNAISAEASSTASVMIFPIRLGPTIPAEFLPEQHLKRRGIGEVRLHFADDRVQGAHHDSSFGRFQYKRVAGLQPQLLTQLHWYDYPSSFSQLCVNDIGHRDSPFVPDVVNTRSL